MSARMFYGNYEFDPVPLYTWTTETVYDGKQDRNYLRHTCDFAGSLLDVASESGSLATMITKRNALKDALASGYQEWSITRDGETLVDNIYPRISNVAFEQGVWVDRINYSFTLEYDEDFYNTGIQSYSETWSFDENEDRETATVVHQISAVGQNTATSGESNAFTNAKTFVLGKTGYSNVISGAPGFIQTSGTVSAYEELRTEQADAQAGSYTVSENFILSAEDYIHTSTGSIAQDEEGVQTVSLDGTIRGLGRSTTAWDNALAAWPTVRDNFPSVASGVYSNFGGLATLYTTNYQSFSITKNEFAGTIDYSVSYSDSLAENLPSGILEFNLSVQDDKPVRLYASFPIMERALGNVVQDIATSTEGTFTITGNATCKTDYVFDDLVDYCETKINAKRPSLVNYETLRLSQKSVTRDEDNRQISWSLVWTYTTALSQAAVDGDVVL